MPADVVEVESPLPWWAPLPWWLLEPVMEGGAEAATGADVEVTGTGADVAADVAGDVARGAAEGAARAVAPLVIGGVVVGLLVLTAAGGYAVWRASR